MKRASILLACILQCLIVSAKNIDIKHTKLHLRFDWKQKQAIGNAEITLSNIRDTGSIVLDAGFLSIEKISIGSKALAFKYDGDDKKNNVEIILDRTYKANETFTITIAYRTNHENKADPNAIFGSFGKGLRFFQPTSTTPTKRKQIWSSGEAESNKYWFPCNEDIGDLFSMEVIATIDTPLMLISNGTLVGTIKNNDGTETFHYKSETEFPNYLAFIVVGEYDDILLNSRQTTIHNFGYPDEKEAVKATTVLLPDMMHFLETKTGYSYPFKTYSQVVVQDYPYPGLVGQHTASLLSDNYIDDYGVHNDFKYLWDGVAMQALANQWFGNLLMPKSWNDIWLNNAFAQYFAGIYTEKDNSKEEYLLWYYPFEKGAVLSDRQANYKHAIVPDKIDQIENFNNNNYSKFKGALVLRMLQNELGDDVWWKIIQYYVKQNAYKQVTTKDFQSAVEKISGKSYQWFFDQWIYKVGLPKFIVSKLCKKENQIIELTIIQNPENDTTAQFPQVEYFQGKIGVEIDGEQYSIFLKPQMKNVFEFNCKKEASYVNFNVANTFLSEVVYTQTKEEYISILKSSNDIIAKRNALNNLVTIAKDSTVSASDKSKIKEHFVAEIKSKNYWRWRTIVLTALSNISSMPYDESFTKLLKELIANETSWLKSSAINILGNTSDSLHLSLYVEALKDESDRVINSAAIAIGKTKSSKAFDILMGLENQKSWKNQNRISALNGLEQLGDVKAANYALDCIKDNHSPRWYLATPVWDYPFAAVKTLVSLGKAESAYPILLERCKQSLNEDDLNDIFQNLQLIDVLNDKRAIEVYSLLKQKFKDDHSVIEVINTYEMNYLKNIKP